jgi:hypothetical protein
MTTCINCGSLVESGTCTNSTCALSRKQPAALIPARILGQDDWLIFARTADGRLIYTVIETDGRWLDAPHKADCWDEVTGRNCCGDTMVTCRLDNSYMLLQVTRHAREYYWQESDYPLDVPDNEFAAASRARYLCD